MFSDVLTWLPEATVVLRFAGAAIGFGLAVSGLVRRLRRPVTSTVEAVPGTGYRSRRRRAR